LPGTLELLRTRSGLLRPRVHATEDNDSIRRPKN
jgi:hypothetical protein